MTEYKRGDIVLVSFIFSDETGEKRRPVIILCSEKYNKNRQEVIIAAITSNIERILLGDHLINDWQGAGLLYPSIATGIIRTVKQTMIAKKVGIISKPDMKAIEANLRNALGLELKKR